MQATEIVHVLPLDVTLELQKCATLEAAATVIFKVIAQNTKDALGKPESAELSANLDKWLKGLTVCDEILKKSLKQEAIKHGEVVSDAGSKKLQMGQWEIPVTAKGKGSYDDKKVEALLRANGLAPGIWMDEHKSYTTNEAKLVSLAADRPDIAVALENCKKEVSYALMPLRKVVNNEG